MERKQGCICELDEKGNPLVADYAECPVHKPDAPNPKNVSQYFINRHYGLRAIGGMSASERSLAYGIAKQSATIMVEEIISMLNTFKQHEYAKILIPFYEQVKIGISEL